MFVKTAKPHHKLREVSVSFPLFWLFKLRIEEHLQKIEILTLLKLAPLPQLLNLTDLLSGCSEKIHEACTPPSGINQTFMSECYEKSKVAPAFFKDKGKDPHDPASYRPISILPSLSKILEIAV